MISILSFCPRYTEDASLLQVGGKHLGCYTDALGFGLLKGFMRKDWELNSPKLCTIMCSKAGFIYSGVQNGNDCYCGQEPPLERYK